MLPILAKQSGVDIVLTESEDNHISSYDDGAQGRREELGDSAQHHDHADGDVDDPAVIG